LAAFNSAGADWTTASKAKPASRCLFWPMR
jgi:hypothetical protein